MTILKAHRTNVAAVAMVCTVLFAAGAQAKDASVIALTGLGHCLRFTSSEVQTKGLTTTLPLTGELLKHVGECGCKSMGLSYRLNETLESEGHSATYERAYGIVIAPKTSGERKAYEIPIKSDPAVQYHGKLSLEFACQGAD